MLTFPSHAQDASKFYLIFFNKLIYFLWPYSIYYSLYPSQIFIYPSEPPLANNSSDSLSKAFTEI